MPVSRSYISGSKITAVSSGRTSACTSNSDSWSQEEDLPSSLLADSYEGYSSIRSPNYLKNYVFYAYSSNIWKGKLNSSRLHLKGGKILVGKEEEMEINYMITKRKKMS